MYEVKQDVNLYSVFLLFWKVFLLLCFENMENEIIWENMYIISLSLHLKEKL